MFGSAEMSFNDLPAEDQQKVVDLLRMFSESVHQTCASQRVPVGRNPFVRPSNFWSVLCKQGLYLVVDDSPAGAMPEHRYTDARQQAGLISLDALVHQAVRELGYRKPIGVIIPTNLLGADAGVVKPSLAPLVNELCTQFAEQLKMEQLGLLDGYQHLLPYFPAFLRDHPAIERNVFLMMRFRQGEQYAQITTAIRDQLRPRGLDVMRADDRDYTGDLWSNVSLYMLGCTYGIAVFEEIDVREFNPNVALELGFMMAHNKRCMILKDQRMSKVPTDVVGKLYKEFDTYHIGESIAKCTEAWIRDIGLL